MEYIEELINELDNDLRAKAHGEYLNMYKQDLIESAEYEVEEEEAEMDNTQYTETTNTTKSSGTDWEFIAELIKVWTEPIDFKAEKRKEKRRRKNKKVKGRHMKEY